MSILLTPLLLAGALSVAVPAAPTVIPNASTTAGEGEPLVSVVHDLRGLGPEVTHERVELPLLPLLGDEIEPRSRDRELDHAWGEWAYELLVDVLFENELQYEGRRIDYDGEALSVIAPAAVQADVARLLTYLRRVGRRSASVRLQAFELAAGQSLPDGLDRASLDELDALVERRVLTRLPERRERVRLGQPLLREQLEHRDLLRGWEVEIAQKSVGLASEVERVATGTRTLLWASADVPGSERCRVGLADLRSFLAQVEPRTFDLQDEVVLEATTRELTGPIELDLHRISALDLVGDAWLAPGDSFVLAAGTSTHAGASGGVLRVELEALDPEPEPVRIGDHWLRLFDLSAAAHSDAGLPAITSGQLRGEFEGETLKLGYRDWCIPTLERDSSDPIWRDSLFQRLENLEYVQGARVLTSRAWALVCASETDVGVFASDLVALAEPSSSRTLWWRLVRADETAVSSGVLTFGEQDALAVVGESVSALRGVEVDVATGAVAQAPVVMDLFDGCWVRARSSGPDEVLLSLASNRVTSWDSSPPGPGMKGLLDRLGLASSDLTVSVPADGLEHELASLASGLRLVARVTAR